MLLSCEFDCMRSNFLYNAVEQLCQPVSLFVAYRYVNFFSLFFVYR